MALTDDQIRTTLSPLLAEADRCKDKILGRFVIAGAVLGLVVGSLAYGYLDDTLELWAGPSFIIAVVIGFLVLALFGTTADCIVKWRIGKIARRFRTSFPEESGDYARAVLILKSAKTKEKVEQGLLTALEPPKDVDFGAVPKAVKAAKQAAGGLLGGFGPSPDKAPKAAAKSTEPDGDGVIPLDPFGATRKDKTR